MRERTVSCARPSTRRPVSECVLFLSLSSASPRLALTLDSLQVAIKKVMPFDHSMFALRTLRELKLLRFFAEHQVSENLITVIDLIKPVSYDSFQEVRSSRNRRLERGSRADAVSSARRST